MSCKKDKFLLDPYAQVSFSQDSVLFDTVFTTIGSTTKAIRVINNNNQKINIKSLFLNNGNSSAFTLNVDGLPGKVFSDIEIDANDSIYIFIQVYVNPTNINSPLIISDKIVFQINDSEQSIYLEAWGQDAYYHFPTNAIQYKDGFLPYSIISNTNNSITTWNNDKPHVIYGWLVVDSTQTLIINQGVKVYMHQNASLWVYRYGTLKINGTKNNEVIFQGDRREIEYIDKPGQWDRILINEGSVNNSINYAIIKNGFIGIQASLYPFYNPNTNSISYDMMAQKKLSLTNSIIQNTNGVGLYAEAFNISGGNNVICNTQEYTLYLSLGGKYNFTHCTFANYWSQSQRSKSTLYINNFSGSTGFDLDSCNFRNCIIDGSFSNEIDFNLSNLANANYLFSNSLIKTTTNTNTPNFSQCRVNQSSAFINPSGYDFKLSQGSSAINFNSPSAISDALFYPFDINLNSRTVSPDAGAYEY
jgi:hypothetical protein